LSRKKIRMNHYRFSNAYIASILRLSDKDCRFTLSFSTVLIDQS
jgi:hypothetical protein